MAGAVMEVITAAPHNRLREMLRRSQGRNRAELVA
jgi:hypothetical protein